MMKSRILAFAFLLIGVCLAGIGCALTTASATPRVPTSTLASPVLPTGQDAPTLVLTPTFAPHITNEYREVSIEEAKRLIVGDPSIVVLDVRTEEEYLSGHLPNALLIPLSEFESRVDSLDRNKRILVYCKSGARSVTASNVLTSHGFGAVHNMVGGIMAWIEAGNNVETSAPK